MPVRKYKPTTNGLRNMSVLTYEEITTVLANDSNIVKVYMAKVDDKDTALCYDGSTFVENFDYVLECYGINAHNILPD